MLGILVLPGAPARLTALAATAAIVWLLEMISRSQSLARAELTERRRTFARLQSIIDSAVDGIITIDARGRIESCNRAAERLFGYTEADLIGRNVRVLMPEPDAGAHDAYIARYLETGDARIIGSGRDVLGRRRDGTTFPLHLSVGVARTGGEIRFTGILHDRSAEVALEEQLREQAALARLGEMAAVVAHEIRNPLAGIRSAIQVIAARVPANGDRPVLEEIIRRIDALHELMRDLLLFSRPPVPRLGMVQLADLVVLTTELLSGDPALEHVDVRVKGSAAPVPGDPELLKIVFQNLLVNGAHAMNGKGRILVELDSATAGTRIAFFDQGPGIPAEIRDKIFTPFFTTKRTGTGLGLPTARRLVEAHHGRISVDCPPDGGTRVSIELPAR